METATSCERRTFPTGHAWYDVHMCQRARHDIRKHSNFRQKPTLKQLKVAAKRRKTIGINFPELKTIAHRKLNTCQARSSILHTSQREHLTNRVGTSEEAGWVNCRLGVGWGGAEHGRWACRSAGRLKPACYWSVLRSNAATLSALRARDSENRAA